MEKKGQFGYSDASHIGIGIPTLQDLFKAIRGDPGISIIEQARLINQIKSLTQHANGSTPLSALMARGLGGTIGWLISKYFGMGSVGQIVSTLAGFGIGKSIHDQLNKPPNPTPGWRLLG